MHVRTHIIIWLRIYFLCINNKPQISPNKPPSLTRHTHKCILAQRVCLLCSIIIAPFRIRCSKDHHKNMTNWKHILRWKLRKAQHALSNDLRSATTWTLICPDAVTSYKILDLKNNSLVREIFCVVERLCFDKWVSSGFISRLFKVVWPVMILGRFALN